MSILSQFDQNIDCKSAFLAAKQLFKLMAKPNSYLNAIDTKEILDSRSILVDSGRTALYLILEQLKLNNTDQSKNQILVSGFTCVVVINAILKAGLTPIYVDITNKNFNFNKTDLDKKVSQNTLALIVQNTFGFIDDYEFLTDFAKKNNIYLIEDLAHSIGGTYNGLKLGSFGDFAFYSFGSNKIITTSRGGAILAKDSKQFTDLKRSIQDLAPLSFKEYFKHLFKIITFFIFSKIYFVLNIGKLILATLSKLNLYPKIITVDEKKLDFQSITPSLYAKIFEPLLNYQLNTLSRNLEHRRMIANYYYQNLNNSYTQDLNPNFNQDTFLYFPVTFKSYKQLIKAYNLALKFKIQLSIEWTGQNIVPKIQDSYFQNSKYKLSSCPNAESISKVTLCLPTHKNINLTKANKIIKFLNNEQLHS